MLSALGVMGRISNRRDSYPGCGSLPGLLRSHAPHREAKQLFAYESHYRFTTRADNVASG